jgi:hypothetical protein
MAYSRFSYSHWYTYWFAGDGRTRDTQLFDICTVKTFTYQELTTDIENCLEKIRELDPKATDLEILELKTYMREFIDDIKDNRDLIYCEKLQDGTIEEPKEFIEWFNNLYPVRLKEEINEALTVLSSDDLPLLIGTLKGDLGKLLLEKRLKGIVARQTWPMEKIIY